MNNVELIPFDSDDALAREVAAAWLSEIEQSGRRAVPHTVALSGGRIAKRLFACAVELAAARKTDFSHAHIFWADERCVPPEDAESNFKLARELLLEPLHIPSGNIHRILGEEPAEFAVQEAEAELCRIAPLDADGMPVLDLVFLGMGEDGHVASLFPGASPEVVDFSLPFLAIADSPKPPPKRVSLSYRALALARQVWVLATGRGKEAALSESLRRDGKTPLARVIFMRKATRVFTDITGI